MIDVSELVTTESTNEAHRDLYRTLSLLRLFDAEGGPIYFVVAGLGLVTADDALDDSYKFDEADCPTNYVPVEAILTPESDDPHGVFDYICTRWMTKGYLAAKEAGTEATFLRILFPEINGGPLIDGEMDPPFVTSATR